MIRTYVHALSLTVVLSTVTTWAQTTATAPSTQPATMAATEPSTEPSTQPVVFAATEKAAILKAVGSHATITGKVSRTNAIPAITFINFAGTERGDFTVIVKADSLDAVNKGFNGDVAAAVDGKKITVTGTITKYRETPQIEVTKPEQITITKE